jgi:hypothetical protein
LLQQFDRKAESACRNGVVKATSAAGAPALVKPDCRPLAARHFGGYSLNGNRGQPMAVACNILVRGGPSSQGEFEEVPRAGDFIYMPNAATFHVDRVVFRVANSNQPTVDLLVSPGKP